MCSRTVPLQTRCSELSAEWNRISLTATRFVALPSLSRPWLISTVRPRRLRPTPLSLPGDLFSRATDEDPFDYSDDEIEEEVRPLPRPPLPLSGLLG